jgi:hypothetical protein
MPPRKVTGRGSTWGSGLPQPEPGVIVLYEVGGRLRAQIRTNLSEKELRRRLAAAGLGPFLEAVEGEFLDPTRLCGGNAFILLWKVGTTREDVREALCRLY